MSRSSLTVQIREAIADDLTAIAGLAVDAFGNDKTMQNLVEPFTTRLDPALSFEYPGSVFDQTAAAALNSPRLCPAIAFGVTPRVIRFCTMASSMV